MQQVMDNYHQIKLDVREIISLQAGKLRAARERENT
jgi:hypothetical protein